MLNRRLIIDHTYLVKQALSVRYPPYTLNMSKNLEDLWDTIDQVATLGQQAFDLDKQIDDLRRERNQISDSFPKASKDEKISLKLKVAHIKTEIAELEKLYEMTEKQCQEYVLHIPNVPDPGIPLWSGISQDNEEFYRVVLRIVHGFIDEYSGNRIVEDE